MNTQEMMDLVDEMVGVDTAIKRLEERKEKLRASLITLGEGSHSGSIGKVAISTQERKSFSKDKVVALGVLSDAQIEACYAVSKSVMCRVTEFGAK